MSEGTGTVKLRLEPETWSRITASSDPGAEVHRRGVDVLRARYDVSEDEAEKISNDPTFRQSCADSYVEARKDFDRNRKVPGSLVLRFNRPRDETPSDAKAGPTAAAARPE